MTDIIYLIILIAAVLIGFAQAFWLLTVPYHDEDFGSIDFSFLNTFLYMLGQEFSLDFTNNSVSPVFTRLVLVLFISFTLIVLLNMLIAQMGDSFNKINEKGSLFRLAQASLIVRKCQSDFKYEKNCVTHVLMYTSRVKETNYDAQIDFYSDLCTAIKKHIMYLKDNERNYDNNDMMYKVSSVKDELLKECNNLKFDFTKQQHLTKLTLREKLQQVEDRMESRISLLEGKIDRVENKLDLILSRLG